MEAEIVDQLIDLGDRLEAEIAELITAKESFKKTVAALSTHAAAAEIDKVRADGGADGQPKDRTGNANQVEAGAAVDTPLPVEQPADQADQDQGTIEKTTAIRQAVGGIFGESLDAVRAHASRDDIINRVAMLSGEKRDALADLLGAGNVHAGVALANYLGVMKKQNPRPGSGLQS